MADSRSPPLLARPGEPAAAARLQPIRHFRKPLLALVLAPVPSRPSGILPREHPRLYCQSLVVMRQQ